MTTIQERLLPCPFCGGEAKHTSRANEGNSGWQHDVDHWVYCTSDDCLADIGMCETKDEAIRMWNTRPAADYIDKLEAALGDTYRLASNPKGFSQYRESILNAARAALEGEA